jgi:TP901 family phage tail tape measure protein
MANAGEIRARLTLENAAFKRGMQEARDEMSKSAKKSDDFKKSIDAIQKASLAVGTAVVAGIGTSVKLAADFEQAMARVKAVSGATDEQFQALEQTARDLGATTQFSASEAAEGMNFLAMAGFEVNEIIASMPGVLNLASAAQVDLGRSSDIVSNILTGFGMSADETGRAVDVLVATMSSANTDLPQLGEAMKYVAPIANALGLDIEETAAAVAKMSDAGIQGSQAGTALRAALLSLTNPTGQTIKAMDELGIKVTDADGALKPLPELIGHVASKLDGMTEAQKTQTVAQLVGTEAASGFLALLEVGEDGLADYSEGLRNSAGAAEEMATIQNDTVNGAFKAFQSALSEVGISVGREFLPVVREIVDRGTDIVRVFGEMDASTVALGLKMAGVASGVALAATTIVKLSVALKGLYLAMGPTGWVIIGLSLAAAAAYAFYEANGKLHDVSLETVDALNEQADTLETNVSRFDELRDKAHLTVDEFGRLLDIQAELNREQDPEKVAALKDEYEGLREKSGLTNEELSEMLGLNNDIIDQSPTVERTFTDKGSAIVGATDSVREYIQSLRDMAWEELQIERLKALENEKDLRKENEELLVKAEQREGSINRILELRELSEAEIHARLQDITEEINNGVTTKEDFLRLVEEEKDLQSILHGNEVERLSKLQEQAKELRTKIALNDEELAKLEVIDEKMVEMLLQQVGINDAKGDGVEKINEAIGKEQESIDKLRKLQEEQGGLNADVDNEISRRQENIRKLETTRGKINEINGAQDTVNDRIYEGYLQAKKLDDSLSVKDYLKRINVTDGGTLAALEARMSRPVSKTLNIKEQTLGKYGIKYHQGGLIGKQSGTLADIPKLHSGGTGASIMRDNPPMHNEVDVRLLRNEMVLTEGQQANLFRMFQSGQSPKDGGTTSDYSPEMLGLLRNIESAIRETGDKSLVMDSRELGRLVEREVSGIQAHDFDAQLRIRGEKRR